MKSTRWPFFLPRTKKGIFWYALFGVIFLMYHDFWAWGKVEPLIGGWLPAWFLYLMLLIVVYALLAFFFTKKYWPPPPHDITGSSSEQKSSEGG